MALIAGTIIICWFINSTLLENYYIYNKQTVLQNSYHRINEAAESGSIHSKEFALEFERIWTMNNLSVLIIDSSTETVMASVNDVGLLARRILDYSFNQDNERSKVVYESEKYMIQITRDKRINADYIEMLGTLENGNFFIMRTALESIRESVELANRFLAYVGSIAIVLSGIVAWLVAKKVTEPVLELASLAERMASLDFEAKYESDDKNEIGLLGNYMNRVSSTLEETISELKTANTELKSDIEKKEQMDEMRKEFLSNVSHELKTPIALIQGYAEGLKEGINDDEESRNFYCDVIMDEADKMNQMVKNLLTLNQLEFGNEVVTMERFNITDMIKNYIQSVDILAKQKEAQIIFREEKPYFVWADEFKTEEVFMNYLSNAFHHVANEMVIEVKVRQEDQKVRVSVFNTGEPIPEGAIEHIWTKFYKVDKARTREYGGSGVGLSIVKAIMESFNEKYGVKNYENGVEFWFELDCRLHKL